MDASQTTSCCACGESISCHWEGTEKPQASARTTAGTSTATTFCARCQRIPRSLLSQSGVRSLSAARPPTRPPTRPPSQQMQGTNRLGGGVGGSGVIGRTPSRGRSARSPARSTAACWTKPRTSAKGKGSITRRVPTLSSCLRNAFLGGRVLSRRQTFRARRHHPGQKDCLSAHRGPSASSSLSYAHRGR